MKKSIPPKALIPAGLLFWASFYIIGGAIGSLLACLGLLLFLFGITGLFKKKPISPTKSIPEIGKDVPWNDVLKTVFRVIDFDKNGTHITSLGEVKAKSTHEPYGYLLVDSPIFNQPVGLPIIHRDDFMLASSVFDNPDVMQTNKTQHREFIVTYQPQKTTHDGRSASPAHCLHYALVDNGALNRYYADTAHISHPEPALLFGKFAYTGKIQVITSMQP